MVQYRHLIPAPVDRTFASDWLYYHAWIPCQKNKPSTAMTQVACESKLRSVVRSSMHPCPENLIAIGRAVVYYAQAAHAFSAGIKCRHCSLENRIEYREWTVNLSITNWIIDIMCYLEEGWYGDAVIGQVAYITPGQVRSRRILVLPSAGI